MIKEITVKYCKANTKYDVFIDGEYVGKHYEIKEALASLIKRLEYYEKKI